MTCAIPEGHIPIPKGLVLRCIRMGCRIGPWAACVIVLACGCATVTPEARQAQRTGLVEDLTKATQTALADGEALRLSDCVALALANNMDIEAAGIQSRIARLKRNVAFSNFLPSLELSSNYVAYDRQPKTMMFGVLAAPMQDQEIWQTALDIEMPVFVPATWFLYSMHKRGAEIADLAVEYTRQMVTLQVSVLYFNALALEETKQAVEAQIEAAKSLCQQLASYREEGLASAWQVEQGEALLLSQENALRQVERGYRQVEAQLLQAMGLSPLGSVALAGETPLEGPEGTLEELVLKGLMTHPKLRIADESVAIQQDQVKIAIAEFLPKLVGIGSFTHTTNSTTFYADSWMGGLAGVMTVFNGLKNVNEYKIARQEREAAYLEREQACLTLMVQVVEADLNLENAGDALALAEKAAFVASGRWTEVEARAREGLVSPADELSAFADRVGAGTQVTNARYQRQVCIATLLNVLGLGYAGYEVSNHEDEL